MRRGIPTWATRSPARAGQGEAIELLKEAFVCVSIPIVAFAFAYLALQAAIRIFLG